MKFLSMRDLHGESESLWDDLQKEQEMVITSDGHPIAVLSATTETELKQTITALRRNRVQSAISAIQQNSIKNGLDHLTLDEINQEIQNSRQVRPVNRIW